MTWPAAWLLALTLGGRSAYEAAAFSFAPHGAVVDRGQHHHRRTRGSSSVVILHSSRKDEFWRECALLLASNFEPSQIGRVLDFGSYARGQMPVPAPEVPGHECSEEFFPGLDARPWHEPAQFPWIEGLELQAGVMQEELRSVLADSGRTFSGDSALQSQVMGSGWSAIRLQRLGRWNDETVQLFPKVGRIFGYCPPPFPPAGKPTRLDR